MKFPSLANLAQQLPTLGSYRLWVIAIKDEEERKLRSKELLKLVAHQSPAEIIKMSIEQEGDIARLQEEIVTASIFYPEKVVFFRALEKHIAPHGAFLRQIPSGVKAIWVTEALSDKLYKQLSEHALVVEPREEKPWEMKDRLIRQVEGYFAREKKGMSSSTAAAIVEGVGLDEVALRQCCFNISCYVGERSRITDQDVEACLTSVQKMTSWQLVDMILLGEKPVSLAKIDRRVDGIALIGQLRFKVHQLLKKKGGAMENFPKAINRYLEAYEAVDRRFFMELSKLLTEMEFGFKNGIKDATSSIDYLWMAISDLKQRYTLASKKGR